MSLATIQQLVDDKMRSAALGTSADTGTRDRAIGLALQAFSDDHPQRVAEEVANVTGATVPLPPSWVVGRSQLGAVEFPLDEFPRAELPATAYLNGSALRIALHEHVLTAATVRVHFSAPHAEDGSTVPAELENAVACWAAAELCRQLATRKAHAGDATINAMAVAGQSGSSDLARRAKEWMSIYRQELGLPDPDAAGGGGGAAAMARPAGAMATWGAQRQRGRFSSWQG